MCYASAIGMGACLDQNCRAVARQRAKGPRPRARSKDQYAREIDQRVRQKTRAEYQKREREIQTRTEMSRAQQACAERGIRAGLDTIATYARTTYVRIVWHYRHGTS